MTHNEMFTAVMRSGGSNIHQGLRLTEKNGWEFWFLKDHMYQILRKLASIGNDEASRLWKDIQRTLPKRRGPVPMSGVDLSGLDLTGFPLDNIDLRGADLSGTRIFETRVADCNFTGASFRNTNLLQSMFFRCKLDGVEFRGVQGPTSMWSYGNTMTSARFDAPGEERLLGSSQRFRSETPNTGGVRVIKTIKEMRAADW